MNDFFKKTWKYIAAFVGGVLAAIGIVFIRNSTIDGDFKRVREQLATNKKLLDELNNDNAELRAKLDKSRATIDELEIKSKLAVGNVDEIKSINKQLTDESSNLDGAISNLRKFIQENGTY